MGAPELWLVAGPNGAGKTTLVQAQPIARLLPHVRFLNPDDYALKTLREEGWRGFADAPSAVQQKAFLAAVRSVADDLDRALLRREAVGVETVLSSDKYHPLVERTRLAGGFVGLIYVSLASPELACSRVARRFRQGGHDVPPEKIRARWQRSLANLPRFARAASAFWVFDNSDEQADQPPLLAATGKDGWLEFIAPSTPSALRRALMELPRRPGTAAEQ